MLKNHALSLIFIVLLVAITSIIYYYLQLMNEKASLNSLLNQHITLQNQSGRSMANGLASDLSSIMDTIEKAAHLESQRYAILSNPEINTISNSTSKSDVKLP